MKSFFKYASALLLGAAGMYAGLENGGTYLSDEEYYSLKGKAALVEFLDHTPNYQVVNQRNFLSDIIRCHIDNGCSMMEDDVKFWFGLPPYEGHELKMRIMCPVNEVKNWSLCY